MARLVMPMMNGAARVIFSARHIEGADGQTSLMGALARARFEVYIQKNQSR